MGCGHGWLTDCRHTETISVHGAKVAETIGIGGTSKDMHIESLELQRMSAATGLRLGDASDSHVTVNGIGSAHSEYVYPVVTFIAQSDDAYVLFATEASTFYAISAQADNAVAVQVDVTATTGYLYLDGDYENSSSGDTVNDVQFAAVLDCVSRDTDDPGEHHWQHQCLQLSSHWLLVLVWCCWMT